MKPKIIIAVVIAHVPENSAGNTWAFLNWALAFRQAGWDVWLVEQMALGDLLWCGGADPSRREPGESRNAVLWRQIAAEFGFAEQATFFVDAAAENAEAFDEFAAEAELFLNISGQFKLHDRVATIPRRIYLDLDPAFAQLWADSGVDMNLDAHTDFFTCGSLVATANLPQVGRLWKPTLPPVALDYWRSGFENDAPFSAEADPQGAWTTITHWYGYSQMLWQGRTYGNKRDSLLLVQELPKRGFSLLVATDLLPEWGDYDEFVADGWRFVLPDKICADWKTYRAFLARSRGEFSVAKHGYVASRCGWFSDRAATYLALGRPVSLQDTGWPEALPTGHGLKSWSTLDEAAAALRAFESDPDAHSRAARQIAEEFLDAPKVARAMLEKL